MSKNKNEKNVLKLVRKSNELVEARYKFDIWETRVFTKMLTMVRRDDQDFKNYRIYLKDVVKDFGLENNNDAYDRLRAGGMKLMSKVVKVVRPTEEGLMELNTPIVVGMEHLIEPNKKVEDAKFIDISFHPKMKPFLLRIYELLKQYQKIGKRKFQVQELKEVIGVIEEIDVNGKKKYKDNYPLYGNFKQRVLLKAQKDLKQYTDIHFTFDQIKRGRSVAEIQFYIFQNKPERVDEEGVNEVKKPTDNNDTFIVEIHEMVKEWVGLSTVRSWTKKYPELQIRNGVNYTLRQLEAGKGIKEVGGYLQTMVAKADLVDAKAAKRKAATERKKKELELQKRKEQLEEALKMLQAEKLKAEDKIIEKLLKEQPNVEAEMMEAVKKSQFSQYNRSLSEEENMKNPMVRASFRNMVKKHFGGSFDEVQKTFTAKIKKIKLELSKL